MAKLPTKIKYALESLFEMDGGYVLDFSNASFARFVSDSVNIDVYDGEGYQGYCSKANKLRQIFANESESVVGKLINDLLEYTKQYYWNRSKLDFIIEKKIEDLLGYSTNMMAGGLNIELPETKEDTLQTLLEDINNSLSRNKPTLVLDRLHTFSTKYLRLICESKGIGVADNKGNFYPLHSLAGIIKKYYEKNEGIKSDFATLAIQNSISLFDKFNSIRNNQSFAHDNAVLKDIEAEFVVKNMANVLIFIDKIEGLNKEIKPTLTNDLPF